jgi:hypothetical protein
MDEIVKQPTEVEKLQDGFDGFIEDVEGDDDQPQAGSVTRGRIRVKFLNEAVYATHGGEELSPHLELIVEDILRTVVKFVGKQLVETIVITPGQKFPNIKELNEKSPRSEWSTAPNGELRGPWQIQYVGLMIDPLTMTAYYFPTSTSGGGGAMRELADKTKWMRKYRAQRVYPVITLSDTFFPTRYGGRQRPHFLIKRWITLDGEQTTLPASEQKQLEDRSKETTETTTTTKSGVVRFDKLKTVAEPTLREELNDEIPI